MAQLPAIQATRKSGKECFEGIGGEHTLQDFWAWAFSDLVSNTERGKLAEYLVAKAMGCGSQISQTWESYDLLSPEGIKIEVKTSAYIQSWKQKAFSKISFGIAKTKFWDGLNYVGEKKRHADVYVFCVLKHKDQETINPLELAQWDFYPVATRKLNTSFENQETVSLGSLISHCKVTACPYSNLKDAIEKEYRA